ncbi:helix-turn-helix transcriptional regulator [Micromonospora echinofusca]|uniref:helix-turn-helix domain-containing protein n=1 Tax=Micromonospora echinofusca TaxID=47858 RepID=UPI00342C80EB
MPADLSEAAERLVIELRILKDNAALSLTRLGQRTSYSKSSWERWLNGKQLPPQQAVERMSAVCGGDGVWLTALWTEAARARAARPGVRGLEAATTPINGRPRSGALSGGTCRLMARVRCLVDRSGLDPVRLEEMTDLSRYTWERWLNGQQPLPKHAVLYLVAACADETPDLVALWEEVTRTSN